MVRSAGEDQDGQGLVRVVVRAATTAACLIGRSAAIAIILRAGAVAEEPIPERVISGPALFLPVFLAVLRSLVVARQRHFLGRRGEDSGFRRRLRLRLVERRGRQILL